MKCLRILATLAIYSLLVSCGGGGGGGFGGLPTSGSGSGSEAGFSVTGKVLDSGPVTKLEISGPSTTSVQAGLDGSYTVAGLQPGTYSLTASDPDGDYTPAQQTVTITNASVVAADFTRTPNGDGLSEELMARLDAAPPSEVTPEQIVFADGQTLAQYRAGLGVPSVKPGIDAPARAKTATEIKLEAIKKMVHRATELSCKRNKPPCPDPKWVYPQDESNPILRPRQSGLAYVFNSKGYEKRAIPAGACQGEYELHGLDCSGLMHLVAAAADISIPTGKAVHQSDPSVWKMAGLTTPVMYQVAGGTLEIGDIVYFSGTGHIGVVSMAGASPEFVASNGRDSKAHCTLNVNKGPTQTKISYFGTPSKILRFKVEETPPEFPLPIVSADLEFVRARPPRCAGVPDEPWRNNQAARGAALDEVWTQRIRAFDVMDGHCLQERWYCRIGNQVCYDWAASAP